MSATHSFTLSANRTKLRKLISIVIPAYNEEDNLDELQRRLAAVFDSCRDFDFEVILVDNGSSDGSWPMIVDIAKRDPRFKSVQLSRNFTAPGGITAGFKYATGDAAIMMCADLQDPPEMIPIFIEKWLEGYDVVYHVVTERRGVPITRKFASELFHWLMNKLTNNSFPRNGSIYRLLDRPAYEAFNQLKETNRYFPGLCAWIGFKSIGVPFPRAERFAGEAKSPFSWVLKLALNGIFSFSYVPLRLISAFGVTIAAASLTYFAWLAITVLIDGSKTVPGIATQVALTTFLFGALFLCMGIIGEYLARIYDEVKGRPHFVVRRLIGLESEVSWAGTTSTVQRQRNSSPLTVTGTIENGKLILDIGAIDFAQSEDLVVKIQKNQATVN